MIWSTIYDILYIILITICILLLWSSYSMWIDFVRNRVFDNKKDFWIGLFPFGIYILWLIYEFPEVWKKFWRKRKQKWIKFYKSIKFYLKKE